MDDSSTIFRHATLTPKQTLRRLLRIYLPHLHIAFALILSTGIYTACMTARAAMIFPMLRVFSVEETVEDADGNEKTEVVPQFLKNIGDFSTTLDAWNTWQGEFEQSLLPYVDYLPMIDVESMSPLSRSRLGTTASMIIYFIVLLVIALISNFGKQYFGSLLVVRTLVAMRIKLLRNLLQQELAFYNEQKRGELVTRMGADVAAAMQAMRIMTKDLLESPLTVLAAVVGLFIAKWWFGVLIVCYLAVIVKSLRKQTGKVHKRARKRQKTVSRVHEAMLQMFSGIRIVKAFGLESEKVREYAERNEDYARQTMATEITKAFTRLRMETFVFGAIIIVLFAALFMIGRPSKMDVGAVSVLLIFLVHSYKPMKTTTRAYTELIDNLAGAARVFEYMDLKPELVDKRGAIEAKDIVGTVRFEDVSFSYGDNGRVLEHISLEVPAGEVCALVGPSGAGKSTLVNMVPRFHDPEEGSVTVDGTDLREFVRESLLDNIAIVTQDAFLFHASIRENIAYGRRDATHEDIVEAAKAANIDEFIQTLPHGYDTVVGEGGGKLSGGQKQRVTIARAIVRDARILILDEATSNLDTESEKAVQGALERLMEGRTTLVIAHRLSTVQHADKICVMQDGRIVEVGSHEQLMATESLYRRLYQLQFQSKTAE